MNKLLVALLPAAALSLSWAAVPANAAGTVILEGSDSIGLHCPIGNASACAYADQTWSAIGLGLAPPFADQVWSA